MNGLEAVNKIDDLQGPPAPQFRERVSQYAKLMGKKALELPIYCSGGCVRPPGQSESVGDEGWRRDSHGRSGNAEGTIHDLNEVPLLAHDEALGLRHCEILKRLGILLQTRLIGLVRSETLESNQPPADIVGSLPRKEVANQMPTAAGNDAAPALRILLEGIPLKGIDFVADDAGDRHSVAPGRLCCKEGGRIGLADEFQRQTGGDHSSDQRGLGQEFTATQRMRRRTRGGDPCIIWTIE